MPTFWPPAQLAELLTHYEPHQRSWQTGTIQASLMHLLADPERTALRALCPEHTFPAGAVVFQENDPADGMYLILAGRAAVLKGSGPAAMLLGYRGTGDVVGEMALIEDTGRSATFVALTELRLLLVPQIHFRELLRQEVDLGLTLLRNLSQRLRAASEDRWSGHLAEQQLAAQVSALHSEKQELLTLQRLRQDTLDFILHDLRNPLGAINAGLRLLEMTLPPAVLQDNTEIVELMQMSIERLQSLIEILLSMARMEANEEPFFFNAVPGDQLLSRAHKRVALQLKQRALQLVVTVPPTLPWVRADVNKLDRVLSNLLENAIKYATVSSTVTLTARPAPEAGWVEVLVSNMGPVIAPEDRERIFDRFAQVTAHDRRRGFGLGLAFCAMVIKAHGGRIWVEPWAEGEGNSFIFTLPSVALGLPNGDLAPTPAELAAA